MGASVVFCNVAFAADLSRTLTAGSSYGEVLSAWGDPLDKVEKDIKREVVWYYKDGAKVVFREGRLKSWRPTSATVAAQKALEDQRQAAEPVATQLASETRDLVLDIAKEVPSGPDVPLPEIPSGNSVAISPNQQARIVPGGIAPAEDLLEEQD